MHVRMDQPGLTWVKLHSYGAQRTQQIEKSAGWQVCRSDRQTAFPILNLVSTTYLRKATSCETARVASLSSSNHRNVRGGVVERFGNRIESLVWGTALADLNVEANVALARAVRAMLNALQGILG